MLLFLLNAAAFLSGPLLFLNIACAPGGCDDVYREGMVMWLWTMGTTFGLTVTILISASFARSRSAVRKARTVRDAVNVCGDGI